MRPAFRVFRRNAPGPVLRSGEERDAHAEERIFPGGSRRRSSTSAGVRTAVRLQRGRSGVGRLTHPDPVRQSATAMVRYPAPSLKNT